MKSNTNSLKSEIGLLSKNPNFIGQFLDEAYFHLPEQTNALTTEEIEPTISEKSASPPESPDEMVQGSPAQEEKSDEIGKDEPASVEQSPLKEDLMPDWSRKVVVLTPQPPSEVEFALLQKVLASVSIVDSDYVHLNRSLHARELVEFESAKIIISFGAVVDFVPDHQVRSKRISVIISSSLGALATNIEAKKKLWTSMKSFFS